ncbi:hypothetical protein BC835DRAFT_1362303, partial [Cytidiella melzeri]
IELSDVHAHSRSVGFGLEVREQILLDTYALVADTSRPQACTSRFRSNLPCT